VKKIIIALMICIAVLGIITAPAIAAAGKADLVAQGSEPGGGFIIVNVTSSPGPAGCSAKLEGTISLKGAYSNTTYDVQVPFWSSYIDLGTLTTDKAGYATMHSFGYLEFLLPPGVYDIEVDVVAPDGIVAFVAQVPMTVK
jgi:hypothetical protein